MSSPDDPDNPATTTGPSYRSTSPAQRGTSPAQRGTLPTNRGTAPAHRGVRVAQPNPGVPPLRGVLDRVNAELDLASSIRQEEATANKLADDLRTHFTATFVVGGSSSLYSPLIGQARPVRVLDKQAFTSQLVKEMDLQWRAEFDVLLGEAQPNFARKFTAARRSGRLSRDYGDKVPTSFDELSVIDARNISPPSPGGSAGGIWSEREQTLFVLSGQATDGLIAHELCHAYTHPRWNAVQLLMAAWDLGSWAAHVDEGVTSELANAVLLHREPRTFGGAPASTKPNGYHGYGADVRTQGRAFLDLIEGPGNGPGHATMAAYFAGEITLKVDQAHPRRSILSIQKKRITLDKLFT